jgi:hypothetical protein
MSLKTILNTEICPGGEPPVAGENTDSKINYEKIINKEILKKINLELYLKKNNHLESKFTNIKNNNLNKKKNIKNRNNKNMKYFKNNKDMRHTQRKPLKK